MRDRGFFATLGFGAVAALSFVFFQVVASPPLDARALAMVHGALCLVLYCAWLGGSPRNALRNGLIALVGAVVILAFTRGAEAGWLGLALVLCVVRSGGRIAAGATRAIAIEATLLLAGFAMASWLSGGGVGGRGLVLGGAFGLWGFALVQSLYFLIPQAVERRASTEASRDPFEEARDQLSKLLDG